MNIFIGIHCGLNENQLLEYETTKRTYTRVYQRQWKMQGIQIALKHFTRNRDSVKRHTK